MKLLETMIQLDLEEFNLFKHIFVFENFSAFVIDSDQNSSSEFNINPLLYNRVSNIQVNFEANKEVVDPDRYYQIQFDSNQQTDQEINNKLKEFLKQANGMISCSIEQNKKKIEGIIYQDFLYFSLCFS